MKQKFSKKWIGSKKARKQRKYRYNAPLHTRHKLMSGNLNKELRKKYGRRNFPLRKGDEVRIMRGKFKGKKGKIGGVDLKKLRVSVEGLQRQKKDGTKINVYFDASNLQIQQLILEDKKRIKALEKNEEKERKKKGGIEVDEEELKRAKKIMEERKNVSKEK